MISFTEIGCIEKIMGAQSQSGEFDKAQESQKEIENLLSKLNEAETYLGIRLDPEVQL